MIAKEIDCISIKDFLMFLAYERQQELMSRNIQFNFIPVTACSLIDLFLDRISLE